MVAAVVVVVSTGEGAADSTAAGATPGVVSTAEAMVGADIMADRPMADIAGAGIEAECMAVAATLEPLDGLGRSSVEACGILRPASIRLPGPAAEACQQLAAEQWARRGAQARALTSPALLTGIFIPSAGSTLRMLRSTMLALWEPAA